MSEFLPSSDWSLFPSSPENPGKTILIACPRMEKVESLVERMEFHGYVVLRAESGEEATEIIHQRTPDLLLSDLELPDMHGEDLCQRVRNDPKSGHVFVVLVVSKSMDMQSVVTAFDAGADEYLAAEASMNEMLMCVRSGIRIVELRKCLERRNEEYRDLSARLNQELAVVASIQRAMLPQILPHAKELDFTGFYLPSTECGGDYYDLIELDKDHWGFVMADVSGHGAPAMVAMALLRQDFHIIAGQFREPHLLLEELNRMLYDHLPTDQYATMHYAIINKRTLECSYASAGHNPPLWYRAELDETQRLPHCEGFPLKLVLRNATYPSHTIHLDPGDRLVFYTDGIPECFNAQRDIYGMERFVEAVAKYAPKRSPRQLETALVTDLMRFADNHPQEDDLTLGIIGVN